MNEFEISNRLRAITNSEWECIIKICYSHVDLMLGSKTKYGAHCEQRLGMSAHEYYVGNAILAIYQQIWEWQFEKYDLAEQLIRIINSRISNEVRKYKSEIKHDKQQPLLIETHVFEQVIGYEVEDPPSNEEYLQKCTEALTKACDNNERYAAFVQLKLKGNSYEEIATKLNCTKEEAYRLMENIGKKAKRILKS
jgi:DNA-directed RNA polymerase specialized sigma24 family protein